MPPPEPEASVAQAAQPQQVTVITETRNLKTPPFTPGDDQISTGKRWEEWLEEIEREFRYFKINDPTDKKDALIIYGGKEIARLEKSLQNPSTGEMNEYEKLKSKLNEHFLPKRNKHHARYKFLSMKPEASETTLAYAARLRERAMECEFGDNLDERILEHLIQTSESRSLIQKAISKKWNLEQFLTEASQMEDTHTMVKDMRETSKEVAKITKHHRQPTKSKEFPRRQTREQCDRCGQEKHTQPQNCPARGRNCMKCHKRGHYAIVCKTKPFTKPQEYKGKTEHPMKKQVKKTTSEEQQDSTSSDDEFFQHLKHAKNLKGGVNQSKIVTVRIDDVDVGVEPDSGADVNIMDEHQFKALIHRSKEQRQLRESKVKLNALQYRLPVKGEFNAIVRNKTRGVSTTFIVVRGRINSAPLIGRATLMDLGMLKIDPEGTLAEANSLGTQQDPQIRMIAAKNKQQPQTGIDEIISRHSKVFEGIGKIRDNKRNEELYVNFSMKPEAVPVAQKPRPVAYHLKEPLRKWLEQGIEEDIFERVPLGEPVTWCSPLVVQPKPKFKDTPREKLEPNMIRASVDLRVPNAYMNRNSITQGPIVEDFTYKFHDCKIFSKMDLRQGYHQLQLHPDSRAIATFSTPWGNMRPKRLVFGAKSSQDLFDQTMYRVFGDIPRCLSQRDDILIGGRNLEEHNQTLEQVLQRAADFNVTFNRDKCQFGVEEIEFYGYRFTKDGLKPTPDKVRAVKECKEPKSKEEVRSFLGMLGYLSKFIPRYSTLTAPLRELTHSNTQFRWGAKEEAAFIKLKESIASENTVAYFNPGRPIIVRTEASFHEGLSAGLFQETSKGLQPVHFISRTMTDPEKRYSQTEKDALAVAWAKERFRMYLVGAPRFRIITAHKPLLPMFNKATAKVPPRIEKWIMSMQDVDFELIYQPGKDEKDPLDFLSRHPLPETDNEEVGAVIKQVTEAEHAVILDKIRQETAKDPQLQKLRERMVTEDWENYRRDPDIMPFYHIRQELYEVEGVILRENKIVVPASVQRKVVKTAHKLGHLGVTKTKQMLREKYWFPTMNSLVEQTVGQCYECQVTVKERTQEPVKPSTIPDRPWQVVSADFGGPYPDGHYNLVVIDKRTRYPEVERVYSTAYKPTMQKLKKIFATYGTPERLESDNGPPFNSAEFARFAKEEGFHHHRVTPDHARANGEAESFMKMLNKTEQIARLQGKDSNVAIQDMLIGYRSTPHPATKTTPYTAMTNRQIRTKLDHHPREFQQEADLQRTITKNDNEYKEKTRKYTENRYVKEHSYVLGDYVLVKQKKRNKWTTAYETAFYVIYRIEGSTISARRTTDGREIRRDASHFKLANSVVQNLEEKEPEVPQQTTEEEDWRGKILLESQEEQDDTVQTAEKGAEQENTQDITAADRRSPQQPPSKKTPVRPQPQETRTRPQRNRRRPAYLSDYLTDI